MGAQVSGTGKRFRITLRSQPKQDSGWFAVTQIAFTGISGGIEGTLLNRGGGTMYGDLLPYTADGASLGTLSARWQNVYAKYLYGNASGTTVSFSTPSNRYNIASGERFSITFGKIARWFSDLKALAFKDTVSKSDLDSDVQTSLGKADSALQSYVESDPTVPAWAKAATKPSYSKSEVGLGNVDNVKQYSANNPPPYPVTSVNGKTGAVTLGKSDVGLGNVDNVKQYSASNPPPYPVTSVNGKTGAVTVSVPSVPSTTKPIKGDGSGGLVAATPETDYASPVIMRKVTLTASGWVDSIKQQAVRVEGVLADTTKQEIRTAPVDASYDGPYKTCVVEQVKQADNAIMYQCSTVPTVDIDVYVTIRAVKYLT